MPNDGNKSVLTSSTLEEPFEDFYGEPNFKLRVYLKYNRACMYGICFLGIFLLLAIIYSTCCDEGCEKNNENSYTSTPNTAKTANTAKTEKIEDTATKSLKVNPPGKCSSIKICDVDYNNKDCSMELEDMNKLIMDNTSDCDTIPELRIYNIKYPTDNLKNHWLTPNVKIQVLGIGYRYITHGCINIEDGAFANIKQFEILSELTFASSFEGCYSTFLKKSMFAGLETDNFKTFNIQLSEQKDVTFEENLFEMFPSLVTLQIQRCFSGPEVLKNITGGRKLKEVVTIDFRYNIKLKVILSDSFKGLPKVAQLYLEGCRIESIEDNAFTGLRTLKLITLTDNYLTVLYEGIFKNVNDKLSININLNPWECTCYLIWMLKLSIKADLSVTNCTDTSKKSHNVAIYLNDNCLDISTTKDSTKTTMISYQPESTSTSHQTVSTTTSQQTESTRFVATTSITEQPVKINCINGNDNTGTTIKQGLQAQLIVQNQESNKIEILLKNNINNLTLIYLNSDEEDASLKSGCISNISQNRNIVVDQNIKENTSYILCLKDKYLSYVSPFDCVAARTLPPKDYQTWLIQKDMLNVYLVFGFTVLISIISTSLGVYYILRKYPNLLKNDKIIVVNPHKEIKNPSTLFGMRKPDAPIFVHPESELIYDRRINHVYLSPLVNRSRPRRRTQSFSDTSSGKNTLASYVAVVEPSDSQLMSWRISSMNRSQLNNMYQHDHPQTPPVPPPRRKRPNFNRDEMGYNGYY